ncbi:MAG: hypothetical protein JO085_10300, partial [Acidimicrobiia bacterium]|nr:hypothetical protein [Acidimicrobiia bacterium]
MRDQVELTATADVDALGLLDQTPAVGAVLFADLSGFAKLTETLGDEAAADTATRFVALVRQSLTP